MTETLTNPALVSANPEGAVELAMPTKRILIVEGDGFTRLALIFLFRLAGFGVDFTSNGTLALGKLRASPHDALLVELKLLGVSGLELIRNARDEPNFGDRPIYVFTNADQMSGAEQKEARKNSCKVFDKRSTDIADMARAIAAEHSVVPLQQPLPDEPPPEAPETGALPPNIVELIRGVDEQCALWLRSTDASGRLESSHELLRRLGCLLSCAEAAGLRKLARHAKALETFLKQLHQQRQTPPDQDLSIIRRSVEVLVQLSGEPAEKVKEVNQFIVAVVDESPSSGGALGAALREAGINPIAFQNPARALTHLASNKVDLVIANVGLPELHGFDPTQISQHPLLSSTSIIFVSDNSGSIDSNKAEPAAAPLVNENSRLLTGLVMKTLNELQGLDQPPTHPKTAIPTTKPAAQKGLTPKSPGRPPPPPARGPFSALLFKTGDRVITDMPTAPAQSSMNPEPSIAMPQVQPVSQPALETNQPANHTILFVEDDPFALKVYSKALQRAGFQVNAAEDGLVALELLPRLKPVLVVLDLMLPKVHGFEVLQFIRADIDLKDTPVIVLSNAYVDQLGARAKKAGANCGLTKTQCTPAKLVQHVCELLKRPAPVASLDPGLEAPGDLPVADQQVAPETDLWVRQANLRQKAPKEVAKIRDLCLGCIKAVDAEKHSVHLGELYRRVRFLSAHASLIGFTKIADVSSVLEGLLFELIFKQAEPTASTYQTIGQAVDFLDRLVLNNDTTFPEPRLEPKVLVVDSDAVGYVSTVSGLQRGRFQVTGTQDPVECIRMLRTNRFDAITLDVNMPHLNGFEVCQQLRRMPEYQAIPVIFTSAKIELQDRARSVTSGGNDLIAKSVSPLELVLRLLMHTLRPSDQALDVNSRSQAAARTAIAAKDPDACWVIEEDTAAAQPQVADESFALAPATSPDSTADWAAAASPSCEPFQADPAGLATPQAEEQADTSTQSPTDTVIEWRIDESHGGITESPIALSETPQEQLFQPAPKAGEDGTDWQAPAGATVEPASPLPGEASNWTNPTAESNEADGLGLAPAPQARQAETDWAAAAGALEAEALSAPSAPFVSAHPAAPVESEPYSPPQTDPAPTDPAAEAAAPFAFAVPPSVSQGIQTEAVTAIPDAPAAGQASPSSATPHGTPDTGQSDLAQQLLALQAQFAKQGETNAKYAAERESLVNRIVDAQNQLHRLETRLQRKDEAMEKLQKQLDERKGQPDGADSGEAAKDLQAQSDAHAAELERVRAEAVKYARDRELAESDLRLQLEAAERTAEQSAATQQQAQSRCEQLEQELAGLRQARENLDARIAQEQQTSEDTAKRIKELEEQSARHAADLEHAKEEAVKQSKERELAESDLRWRLEAAGVTATQSATAHQQAQARCEQMDKELAELRKAGENLHSQLANEQQAAADSTRRIKEFEEQSARHTAELEAARAEAAKQAKERELAESDLRQQLEVLRLAAAQKDAAHQQAQSRRDELDLELTGLRQVRENLNHQLANEQQVSARSAGRVKELEDQSARHAAELEAARTEVAKQAKEHEHAESDLKRQLEASTTAAAKSAAAHLVTQTRCEKLEKDLAGQRQAREQLNTQVAKEQKATASSVRRIQELQDQSARHAAELEAARTEAASQAKDREDAESDLKRQLEASGLAAAKSATAHQQAQARCDQLEKEVAGLRQAREQLNTQCGQLEQELAGLRQACDKLHTQAAKDQQHGTDSARRIKDLETQSTRHAAELDSARAEAAKHSKDRELAESDLRRQLEAAGLAATQSAAAHKAAQTRCDQLQHELAAAHQARENLNAQVGKEQQAGADSARRLKELEEQLEQQSSQQAADLARAKAAAEKLGKERDAAESDLRRQLEAASNNAAQAASAHQEAQARCQQLDQQVAGMHQAREDLTNQLAKEQRLSADAARQLKDLEEQLQSNGGIGKAQAAEMEQRIAHGVAALARVTADLAKERGERQRIEARATALNQRLQELLPELKRLLESQRADQERIGGLEGQLRQRDEAFNRQSAELEEQKAQWQMAEEQLHKSSDLNANLGKRLSSFDAAHKSLNSTQQDLQARLDSALDSVQETGSKLQHESAERQRLAAALEEAAHDLQNQNRKHGTLETEHQATLQALQERESKLQQETAERQRLAAALDAVQRELQNHSRNRETLESDFKTASQALRESESKAQQESAERQRLSTALDAAQLNHHDHVQRTDLELSKAQSALQFEQAEHERLEAQMARMRHAALDSARSSRLLRNAWRNQMRAPVDNLYQSANSLLQLEITDQQKKLAEAILQDILLVHTKLQEPDAPAADPGEPPRNEPS